MLEKQKQNLKKLSIASKKTRITWEMISIATRQWLQKIGNERLNLSHVASRVDDILWGDGIEDLIHTLQKCWIMLFDEDWIFQLTQQQVQNISFQAPILKKLVEIGLNINNIDQVKYISSVNEEFLQWLMEWDKLKKILRLWVRVSVQVYEWVLKDLLQISKLSLQYVDDFLHNESILKLKKDWYNFTIDSITMVLPTDQEYLVLKKWYDFAKDRWISYDSCICELRKTWLTSDWLDKLHMFFKNNEINLNDYFSKYSINFKTVEILSELDESELKKILSISQKSQELNVFEIINIKSKNPEFIFNWENSASLILNFWK